MKMSVIHIQFPIGEGGLHFGVIGDKAYIYDCGHCGTYVAEHQIYLKYFCIIEHLLGKKDIKELNIYISHMHIDHCNLLQGFLDSIKLMRIKIIIWIPNINNPEKIHLLLTSDLSRAVYGNSFRLISDPKNFLNVNNDNLLLHEIPPTPENRDSGDVADGFYRITGIEKSTSDWVIDPFVIKGKINPNLVQYINNKFNDNLRMLEDYDKFIEFQKEYKKEMEALKEDYHHSMLCLYAGQDIKTTPIYTNHFLHHYYYLSFRNEILSGWMHTGDAILKKRRNPEFYEHYNKYANYIGFMQIPHHGSQDNHNENFAKDMFGENLSERIFYLTCSICGGRAKPKIDDIDSHIKIWPVVEFCNSCIVARVT